MNGGKVGKDGTWPLDHNAEISFTGANTVRKVLGRGATGEVRLGFRIPDLQRVAIKIICKRTNSTISSKDVSQ